jgi:hypothetical protein
MRVFAGEHTKGHMFERATVVGGVAARWSMHPCYMHTFGITENFFVIVEQPLSVSVPAMVRNTFSGEPMIANLKWFPDQTVSVSAATPALLRHGMVDFGFFPRHRTVLFALTRLSVSYILFTSISPNCTI